MTDLAPIDFSGDPNEHRRKIADAANAALNGANRTVGEVTLEANETTTTVINAYVTEASHITFEPLTANAAAELGNGTAYISTRTSGTSFVITHANSAQADRTFTYSIENK